MLSLKNLSVNVDGNPILNQLNLEIKAGEVHAVMGPNGSGKSTLSKAIAGHPDYEVVGGEMVYEINRKPCDLIEMEAYMRARNGLFLSFQYPIEITGVTNFSFLRESFNQVCQAQGVDALDPIDFRELLQSKLAKLEMSPQFLQRFVNEGFSGGEKKKNEILQMILLNPRLAILDETDSGLDIDALKIVAKGVNEFRNPKNATLLITHYQRLLDYIVPDYVHILWKGQIVETGGPELAKKLEKVGYDWVGEKYGNREVTA